MLASHNNEYANLPTSSEEEFVRKDCLAILSYLVNNQQELFNPDTRSNGRMIPEISRCRSIYKNLNFNLKEEKKLFILPFDIIGFSFRG